MKNALASLVNLATLLIGITIGIILAPHLEKPAHAVSAEPQAPVPAPTSAATPGGPEQITPGMTVGSIGTYLLLSHHIQSDELVVNGIDLLKLHEGELDLISKLPGVNPGQVQGIVNNAKDTHLYQVATPKQPPSGTAPQNQK